MIINNLKSNILYQYQGSGRDKLNNDVLDSVRSLRKKEF